MGEGEGSAEWMACDDNKNKHTQACLCCLYASECVVELTNHRQSLLQQLNRQLEFDRLSVLFTLIYSLWWCVRVTKRVQSSWWSNTYLSLLLQFFCEWVTLTKFVNNSPRNLYYLFSFSNINKKNKNKLWIFNFYNVSILFLFFSFFFSCIGTPIPLNNICDVDVLFYGAGTERSVKKFVISWSETGPKTFDSPLCERKEVKRRRHTHTTRSSSSVSFAFRSWCHLFTFSLTWNTRQFLPPDDNVYMHQLLFTLTDNSRASPQASIRCMSITNCAANHQLPPQPTQPDEQRVRLKIFFETQWCVGVSVSLSHIIIIYSTLDRHECASIQF